MKSSSFTVIVVFIALSIAGCAMLPLLPVRLAPSSTLPTLRVAFAMSGSSARTVEAEVTSRIEAVLARIEGAKSVDSRSYSGGGYVTVELDRHTDMAQARFEASALLRQVWPDLPDGVSYPTVALRQAESESARPFITLTINAPASPTEIQRYGEESLKPLLAQIDGISKVELSGARPMEWRLRYDVDRMAAIGLTPDDLRQAVSNHYASEFVGLADDGSGQWLRVSLHSDQMGDSCAALDLSAITVATPSGQIVPLDRLVTVSHCEEAPTSYFRVNGLNSVYVSISSDDGANQLKLAKEVGRAISEFEAAMPQGYSVETLYDATDNIRDELGKIYFRTGLTLAILLIFIAVISLSWRYLLMITVCLAANLAVAVLFYHIAQVEIQLYSLAGITISLNLIIDNLIVMTDHYTRRRDRRVFTSLLAATLTTVGALSVVYFMDEATRLSLQDFVTVVIVNLAVSLAVALWLVPALIQRLRIGLRRGGRFARWRKRLSVRSLRLYGLAVALISRYRVALFVVAILAFGLPVFMLPEKVDKEGFWPGLYNSTIGSPTYRDKVKPVADVALGGTLRLFVEKVYNGSYWNREDYEPMLNINATLPNGATISQMNSLIGRMEAYLATFPEIAQFQTSVSSPRRASITVMFRKEHQSDGFPYRLERDVVSKALTLGGGAWSVYGLDDQGFSNDVRETAGSFCVTLTGYNYDELTRWARQMRDTLLTHRRIREVTINSDLTFWKDDYTELYLAIDRDRLARLGINVSQLFQAVQPSFGRAVDCGTVATNGYAENVRLYAAQADSYDLFALMRQPFTVGSRTFNLADVASIERRQSPPEIVKHDQAYRLCLQYEYIGSYKQGEKLLDRDLQTINALLPTGYKAERDQRFYWQRDEPGNYWLLLLVVAVIYLTTTILFNSLRQPLAIILTIPISFIGVFAVFYLFHLKFDQGGFASFILLSGITVNAAIYLANEYNSLRRRRPAMPPIRAYIKAFSIKIVPILLTVLSTILGFIPFVVAAGRESFWFTLAAGTMGGLAMSLLALLIYLPALLLPRRQSVDN